MNIKWIDVKTVSDERGNLSIIESGIDLPFEIKRMYYIWGTIDDLPRGSHAHKALSQAFIAIHGSCDLIFKDGLHEQRFHIDIPSKCLIIPPGYWRDIENFSSDCVLLVLASDHYDKSDYIRDYDEFIAWKLFNGLLIGER